MEGPRSFCVILSDNHTVRPHNNHISAFIHVIPYLRNQLLLIMIAYLPTAANPDAAVAINSPPPLVDPSTMHPAPTSQVLPRSTRTILPSDWYGYSNFS